MFGWMILVWALSAAVEPYDPNIEERTPVGTVGVWVTPADGWYPAVEVWDPGPTGLSLQSSGAYVAFWAEPYAGTNDDLLSEMLTSLERQYESFRVLPASAATVAGDLPGLVALFNGGTDYGRVEGELAVVTYGGLGVVMWAEAQEGQLARVQDDLDSMLDGLEIPR
jgi:hypothetical protein